MKRHKKPNYNDLLIVFIGMGIICIITPKIYAVSIVFATILNIVGIICWLIGVIVGFEAYMLRKNTKQKSMTINYALYIFDLFIQDNKNCRDSETVDVISAMTYVKGYLEKMGYKAEIFDDYAVVNNDKDGEKCGRDVEGV